MAHFARSVARSAAGRSPDSVRVRHMRLLDTFQGWPEVPEASTMHLLLLTVIGPLAISIVIAVLVMGPKYFRKHGVSTEVAKTGDR